MSDRTPTENLSVPSDRDHVLSSPGGSFFILSPGHSGGPILARLLNEVSDARVQHSVRIPVAGKVREGEIDPTASVRAYAEARKTVLESVRSDGLAYGESSPDLTAIAATLADRLPEAKFVVLVRNPWEFAVDALRTIEEDTGPSAGDPSTRGAPQRAEETSATNLFRTVCRRWSESCLRIHRTVRSLDDRRYERVLYEDLVDDRKTVRSLTSFLGLEQIDSEKIDEIFRSRRERAGDGSPTSLRPEEWSTDRHEVLWAECAEAVDALGLDRYATMREVYAAVSESSTDPGPASDVPDGQRIEAGSSRVPTTTIWDYKKFQHRNYPAEIDRSVFVRHRTTPSFLDRETPVTSMGSCFARNVAQYLMHEDYDYLVTERPFQQASAHWDQVFNTACMRQIFEYTFTDEWSPAVRWWPKDDHVQDPYRRDVLYPRDDREEAFEKHRRCSRRALEEAEVVILTLGLIETWRDRRDGMTYYRVPSPRIYDSEVHEFYIQTVGDCLEDLNRIHELLAAHNPEASLVVTVSPVPLFATFRMDTDPVAANMLSKSTLRTAAEYFVHRYDDVHYFPSYEMVLQGVEEPFEEDNRHVTADTVARVMQLFTEMFG